MTDLGKLSWFLGLQSECKNSTIKMNQSRYKENILSMFGMTDCKPRSIPCEIDIKKICDEVDLIHSKPNVKLLAVNIFNGYNHTRYMLYCY